MRLNVVTVLGPIQADNIGHTQTHEHLLLDSNRPEYMGDLDKVLNHPEIAIQELESYHQSGGRTLVEATPPDLGRDPRGLRRIAEASSVNIVMGMGLYREPYYPPWVDFGSTQELTELFIHEIDNGVGDSGIRPGIIGEIGSHRAWVSAREERVFRAAGRAQRERGLGLMTHTPPGAAAQQLAILDEEGTDLTKVAIGHADTWLDLDYHLSILATGAFLSFDHVGNPVYPDDWRAQQTADLIRRGFTDQILLSTDIYMRRRLKAWGGAGYGFLIDAFVPRLRDLGVQDEEIHQITVENPSRFLEVATLPEATTATSVSFQHANERPSHPYGLFRPIEAGP